MYVCVCIPPTLSIFSPCTLPFLPSLSFFLPSRLPFLLPLPSTHLSFVLPELSTRVRLRTVSFPFGASYYTTHPGKHSALGTYAPYFRTLHTHCTYVCLLMELSIYFLFFIPYLTRVHLFRQCYSAVFFHTDPLSFSTSLHSPLLALFYLFLFSFHITLSHPFRLFSSSFSSAIATVLPLSHSSSLR